MEYVEGISLYDYISEHGKVDTEKAVRWIKELCEILEYMHDGRPAIIYRDLKPANVMITKDGKIKLVDFVCPSAFFYLTPKVVYQKCQQKQQM